MTSLGAWRGARTDAGAVFLVTAIDHASGAVLLFPCAAQAFRLRRDTGGLDDVMEHKEIVYGITSMPADLAAPTHLNYYERRHWGAALCGRGRCRVAAFRDLSNAVLVW